MVKTAPLLFRGPNSNRLYAREFHRWKLIEGDPEKPVTRISLVRTTRFDFRILRNQILLVTSVAAAGCLTWLVLQNQWVLWVTVGIIVAFLFVSILGVAFHWYENVCFRDWPVNAFTFETGRICVMNDGGQQHIADDNTRFQVTEHTPINVQGSAGYSELDIVFLDGEATYVVPLIAYEYRNGCTKIARELSAKTDIPLVIDRKSFG